MQAYQEMASLKSEKRDYKTAYMFQKDYSQLNDSIYGWNLIENMANLQSNYEEKINLATIKEKENALQLQKEINSRQRVQTLLVSLLAGLLLALIILLYRNYRRKVKFEQLLEQKVQNRTHELEASRYELERINAEQNDLLKRAYSEGKSILASAKGIYQAALSDIKDPKALDYISKMNEITHRIEKSATVFHKKINS